MYMVCTRVEPAIFEKREDSRRGFREDVFRKRGGGSGTPPPLNYQNIHLREQHFKIFGVIRGNFVCLFQHFPAPFAHLLSHLTRMKVHVLLSVNTVQRFCRMPWKFQGCASFIYFLHLCRTTTFFCKTPDIYSSTLQLK